LKAQTRVVETLHTLAAKLETLQQSQLVQALPIAASRRRRPREAARAVASLVIRPFSNASRCPHCGNGRELRVHYDPSDVRVTEDAAG
jgi:hypothetical protein